MKNKRCSENNKSDNRISDNRMIDDEIDDEWSDDRRYDERISNDRRSDDRRSDDRRSDDRRSDDRINDGRRMSDDRNPDERKSDRKNKEMRKSEIKRNSPLIVISVIFISVLTAAISYAAVYAHIHKETMLSNSYNSHQAILANQNTRGIIYSDSKEILASTSVKDGTEVREYPFAELFAHAVGFECNGRSGLEASANYYLINSHADMTDKIANEAEGNKYPGDNVVTTYNTALQQIAYDSLGVYKGAVIVSEPKTGKILAMVSKPDFDPNTVSEKWDDYMNDSETGTLINRASQGVYPPGSTFKIMTALEYIRENPDNYNDYSYTCTGRFKHDDDSISCYHGESHGKVDFMQSFAKSCNCSFANIGLTLDRTSFAETLSRLLFNSKLPVDMNYTKSSILMGTDISDSDMIQASIGQGKTQMSPLHLNMITDAVANGGLLMKPYEIDHVETSEGKVIKQNKPEKYGSLMTPDESQKLTELMKDVVEEGTGKKLRDAGYTAAGKTGSAEYDNIKGDSHAWFTGFAPADDPQICVTVIIEGAGSGGDYAVPVAKRIFDRYFADRDSTTENASSVETAQ